MVLWLREQPAEKWWWLETAGVDLHQLPTTGRGLAVNPVRKGLLCGLGWNTALFLERRHVLPEARRAEEGECSRGLESRRRPEKGTCFSRLGVVLATRTEVGSGRLAL